MVDLIPVEDKIININNLPPQLQKKIRQYATIDILKDQAKENIKAKQINIDKFISQWLRLKQSKRTQVTSQKAINDFFEYIKSIDVEHPLLVKAEHVLKNKLKSNSICLKICVCSSFYSFLKRYQYVSVNPFLGCSLPKKVYKKAVYTDQNRTIPVMNEEEYQVILDTVIKTSKLRVKSMKNARKSAKRLIPVIHFLGTYGLRVGSLLSVEVKDGYFTYMGKGNKS